MYNLEERNQKIIDAVLEREKRLCPGSVELIGIYGSFQTGDTHTLSDLDLLIVIRCDSGRKLARAFIQDDLGVGHDIYCTYWDDLRRDAKYTHPHISKLMDSRIVYCADAKCLRELETLRDQVRKILAAPFCPEDFERAGKALAEARQYYALAMLADDLTEARKAAGGMLYHLENSVALLNKTYFRLGVKRRCKELGAMEKKPEDLCRMIGDAVTAYDISSLTDCLTRIMKETGRVFEREKASLKTEKRPADAGSLEGTYEEMVSNWRGKMTSAAQTGDRYTAFSSVVSLQDMLDEISGEIAIGHYDAVGCYAPGDLRKTAEDIDSLLESYLEEYRRAGLAVRHYPDIEAFADDYAGKE